MLIELVTHKMKHQGKIGILWKQIVFGIQDGSADHPSVWYMKDHRQFSH